MIGTGRLLTSMSCGVLKVGMVENDLFAVGQSVSEVPSAREFQENSGHVPKYQRNKFCASVNVGSELLYSRKVATTTEHGSDESGFPVFKGSLQRGGWLSICSARGADFHRFFGDKSKQSGLLINKTKKVHR